MHNDPISIQVFFLVVYSFFYKFSIYCMSNENKIISNRNKFNSNKLFRFILLYFLNLIIKKNKKIFCISNQIKKIMTSWIQEKTVLLPLGFDEKIFIKRKRKKKIYYFLLGRITRDKGLHILLKSLEKVKFKFRFFFRCKSYRR